MQSRDFVYWLQGFFEISGASQMSENQVKMVKNHLNLVFIHDIDANDHPDKVETYQSIHDGKKPDKKTTKPPFDMSKTPIRC